VPDIYREKWRLGGEVPINVYGAATAEWPQGRPICQCHTPEDAARIVSAINLQVMLNKWVDEKAKEDKDDPTTG
jgi:hypothetical protein